MAWAPDGTRLASASDDYTVRIWDAASGAQTGELSGHTDLVWAVAWAPDGTRLASASDDQTVRIWDAASGAQTGELSGHTDLVWAVAWAPDGTRLASASDDGTARIWDVTHNTCTAVAVGSSVRWVAWNGGALGVAFDHTVMVYDIAWTGPSASR